jgi:outer membrane protein TolC
MKNIRMKKYSLLFIGSFLLSMAFSQTRKLSLNDIIELAKSQSPNYKLAQTQKEVRFYEYLTYKSDLRPQISAYGNVPVYSKQFTPVTQPDGSILFLPIEQNLNNLGFSLSQVLPFSGGQLSLNTELSQFYDFQSKFNQYNGTPIFLRLDQPLFAFNEFKWRKKIEPLKLEESKREYVQEMENIAQEATDLYFNILDAQSNISIAQANLANDSINYAIERKRINLGTTTEDKLLQLELQVLKSKQALEKAKYDYKIAEFSLRTFIGYKDSLNFVPLLPEQTPTLNIELEKAIEYAKLYRPEYTAFERKNLEAQQQVAQAKAAKQSINLTATYGLNRAASNINTVYSYPKSQKTFSIGINVPIVDWGRRKARYNTAIALEKLTEFNNDLDSASIIEEVTTLVNNIELLKNNISLAKTTDSVAQRRFTIANELYQVGKLTIIELNLAQVEKDDAQRSYVTALRQFWDAYYLLRRLTLYDFERNVPLFNEK